MTRTRPVLIPHVDDLGCAHGANAAIVELTHAEAVTCGSVMVPAMWFPDIARLGAAAGLDLGVHLTLTSESTNARWRPISTADPASGLLDPAGFMWPNVPALRVSADPEAVAAEMRAQLDAALNIGIDVTHLDHHMAAALAPEFVEHTVDLAIDYDLPVLFPRDIPSLLAVSDMGSVDISVLQNAYDRASRRGVAFGETFLMPLIYQGRSDHEAALRECLSELGDGITYLSLHASTPGDIEHVHPNDAAWRLGEYSVLGSVEFQKWMTGLEIDIVGTRWLRDRLRAGVSLDRDLFSGADL